MEKLDVLRSENNKLKITYSKLLAVKENNEKQDNSLIENKKEILKQLIKKNMELKEVNLWNIKFL